MPNPPTSPNVPATQPQGVHTGAAQRGALKIYLGYAAGVGKTYQMLDEAQQMREKGVDVVIGYFEPHGRKDTIGKTEGLEAVPRRIVEYRGASFEEMDTEAIIARRPAICLVDEFAHTNVPGSPRAKRWEDVLVLLEAGIDVFTTMNVQHLESLNDQVHQITGIRVRETVPDWVMEQAAEVVMVDVTPRALINRLERGVVYAPDKAARAMQNFFKESNLAALRELALRQTAHEVEVRAEAEEEEIAATTAAAANGQPGDERRDERVLVFLGPRPATAMLIRRAKRVADYLGADCFAVHVEDKEHPLSTGEREAMERHLTFARNLRVETHELTGDVADALVEFARKNGITQLFMAREEQYDWWQRVRGQSLVHKVVRQAREMQVTIVAERRIG